MIYCIICVIPVLIYCCYILIYFRNSKPFEPVPQNNSDTKVDVLIPLRNEKNNVSFLVNGLKQQEYPKNKIKFILINDHSQDNSVEILIQNISDDDRFTIIHLNNGEYGKKCALLKGLSVSESEIVLFTDADCIHPPHWVNTMVNSYKNTNAKMILGPVIFTEGSTFISKFAEMEFIALMSVTAASARLNKPVLCNGANILIQKKDIISIHNIFNDRYASGDDMFMLTNLKKKYPGSVHFNNTSGAIVQTAPPFTFKLFLLQRLRWVSKNKGINDKDIIINALIVFLANTGLLLLIFASIVNLIYIYFFAWAFLVKTFVDFLFVLKSLKETGKKRLLRYIILFQGFNFLYVPLISILGMFMRVTWKKRKFKR